MSACSRHKQHVPEAKFQEKWKGKDSDAARVFWSIVDELEQARSARAATRELQPVADSSGKRDRALAELGRLQELQKKQKADEGQV